MYVLQQDYRLHLQGGVGTMARINRKEARYRISTTPVAYARSSWNYVWLNLAHTFICDQCERNDLTEPLSEAV